MHTNYFAEQGRDYAKARPQYPADLFAFLASQCERRAVAWDCAAGTGQAAVALASYFDRVIATDISEEQIRNAESRSNVSYSVGAAESYPLQPNSVDLIVVAQAAPWLDLSRFFEHCKMVSVQGGLLSIFGFREVSIDDSIDAVLRRYFELVDPYWPETSRILNDSRYGCIKAPFEELQVPSFEIRLRWKMDQVLSLLDSYSGARAYLKANGALPSQHLEAELRDVWGSPESVREVVIPMSLRVWRVGTSGP